MPEALAALQMPHLDLNGVKTDLAKSVHKNPKPVHVLSVFKFGLYRCC